MKKIFLNEEFDKFTKMIEQRENFAFMRNADGELAIMEGRAVAAQEGNWKSPEYITELGKAIYDSMNLSGEKVFYAVSCPCCDQRAYYWYAGRVANPQNITFANLWINSNYPRFKKWFPTIKRDAVLIANYRAKGRQIGNLNILKHYEIDDDCISFWDNHAAKMISEIRKDYGSVSNLLYVVSAGPMSAPIIAELYKSNPDNCYIDFGSSIDEYYRDGLTRPYMTSGDIYAERNCWMYDPSELSIDVTCVCNLYKRPESLIKQLEALESQSLKPRHIILYQDGISSAKYEVKLNDNLLKHFDDYKKADDNTGVWSRFQFAKDVVKTKYVCVLDDDTIPGERWLENCMTEMLEHGDAGIYGTNGIMMTDDHTYPKGGYFPVGWKNPVKECTQVDFVGHSWFFKTEYLNYMFDDTERFQKLKYVAEDMCLSIKAKEHGIKTYVPPHPVDSIGMWGSIPIFGNIFGNAIEALSFNQDNLSLMQEAVAMYRHNGWKPICVDEQVKLKEAREHVNSEKKRKILLKCKIYIKRILCIK